MPEPRMTRNKAIAIVAKRLLRDSLDVGVVAWEDYPGIGENDWYKVEDEADEIVGHTAEEYEAAYDFLADRSE